MKPLLLTFDVEEFDWPGELGRPLALESQIRVTARGLRRIVPLLRRRGTRATFFVTGEFAQRRPALVAQLAREGHEVGVHGLSHADDYTALDAAVATERLRLARALVEAASGVRARGVRTPRLRPCGAAALGAAGFAYDASPHPTWIPGRYNGLRLPRGPWLEDGVWRVPISVMPGIRAPVSWIIYRSAGSLLGAAAARAAAVAAPYLHLYFHPWEAVPLRPLGVPPLLALRTGGAFLDLLDDLLARHGAPIEPLTVGDFLRRWENDLASPRVTFSTRAG